MIKEENNETLNEIEEMFEDLYKEVLDGIPKDEEGDEWIIS